MSLYKGNNLIAGNAKLEKEVYSTDEVKTNAVWIDGKPIYRKVINFGALPNNSVKAVEHGVANVDTIYIANGSYIKAGTESYPTVNADVNNISGNWITFANSSSVSIFTRSDRTSLTAILVIEYTKSTD